MQLLLDECLEPEYAHALRKVGYEVATVYDLGLGNSAYQDVDVAATATRMGALMPTVNTRDYRRLYDAGKLTHGVVLLRRKQWQLVEDFSAYVCECLLRSQPALEV